MNAAIAFFVRRGLVVNLLSIMLLLGGLFAAVQIQREAFPSVNFDLIVISSAYPGASPKEIEGLLTTPIERELAGIDGIKTIRSSSYSGMMQILVSIEPQYEDRSRLVSDIQQAINRSILPSDLATQPSIREIKSEQTPVLSFTAYGDISALDLKRRCDHIRDDISLLKGVSHIVQQGSRKEELRVEMNPQRMHAQHISIQDIQTAIQQWNINTPGGRIRIDQQQKVLRIDSQLHSGKDLGMLVLRANDLGHAIYLKDVATISETLVKPSRYIASMGKPAINMIVFKNANEDIIQLVDRVRAYLKTVPEHYQLEIRTYQDFSLFTRLRLGVLSSNGAIGLGLVLLTLILFLRPSVALTTTWGLPIIFFSGLLALYLSGVTLNLLTMFGFIMVLGLMVDDAIIIGENITWHMERGSSPEEAAIKGTQELAGPVITTVLTTIAAFLPLMYMQGVIGKFIYSIPIVVIVLLSFSMLEALFILPNHIRDIAKVNVVSKENRLFALLNRAYSASLYWALKWRYLTVFLCLTGLGASIALATKMPFHLFPSGAESQFYLRINAPIGTSLEETYAILKKVDAELRQRIKPELLETTTLLAGENSADQREAMKQIGDRYGFVRVILIPFNQRDIKVSELMSQLEEPILKLFPDLEISFAMQSSGPPVGRALQVELSRGSEQQRQASAQKLAALLHSIEGVHSIESGQMPDSQELHIQIDRSKAVYAGLNLASIASNIRAAFDGLRVSTIKRGKEEIDITLRYPQALQEHKRNLLNLEIPNKTGGLVPLSYIATLKEEQGSGSIRHRDRDSLLAVSAEIDRKLITSKALNARVKAAESQWLDPNVRAHLGGEEERSKESVQGLIFSFFFALAGIFVLLAIQFNRISYPFLVILSIPFGIIGIIIALYLHQQAISFMALMGFVALTGVVVNAALVMAVFIQRQIEDGLPWRQAVLESGRRRFRAVLLTSITTVLGLLPTAYGWGGFDPFVAPMALSLAWGMMFSTLITLYFIPSAFGIAMDIGTAWHWTIHRIRGR